MVASRQPASRSLRRAPLNLGPALPDHQPQHNACAEGSDPLTRTDIRKKGAAAWLPPSLPVVATGVLTR